MVRRQHFVNVYNDTHHIVKAYAASHKMTVKEAFKEILDATGTIPYEPYRYKFHKPEIRKHILIQVSINDLSRLKKAADEAGTTLLKYSWYIVAHWKANNERLTTLEHN